MGDIAYATTQRSKFDEQLLKTMERIATAVEEIKDNLGAIANHTEELAACVETRATLGTAFITDRRSS